MRSVLLIFKKRFSAILEDFPHLTERFAPNKIFSIKEIIILQNILSFLNSFICNNFLNSFLLPTNKCPHWNFELAHYFDKVPIFPHIYDRSQETEKIHSTGKPTSKDFEQRVLTQFISTAMLCSYTSNTSRLICYISTFMFNLP